jgi:hypothetical protein
VQINKRAMITAASAGGPAIAAAAFAAALPRESPLLPYAALWLIPGIVAMALFAHLARYLRRSGLNRLHIITIYCKLATYVAIALLAALWAAAALAGLGVATVLLRAVILALIGGVFGGIAGMALANLLSAIQGPAGEC